MMMEWVEKVIYFLVLGAPMAWVIYDRNLLKRDVRETQEEIDELQLIVKIQQVEVEYLKDSNRGVLSKIDKLLDMTSRIQQELEYHKGKTTT